MDNKKSLAILLSLGTLVFMGMTSCQTGTQTGALAGGVGGAAIGGIAGGWPGAAIGGVIGAGAGALIGYSIDKNGEKSDLTIEKLCQMRRSGTSESDIKAQLSGKLYPMSPEDAENVVAALKECGFSKDFCNWYRNHVVKVAR